MATLNLTTAGSFAALNDTVYQTANAQPAGTGVFNTFLRVQATPTEQGYNTDGTLQFNTGTGSHSILLAQIPIVFGDGTGGTQEGVAYREFRLDLNEPSGDKALISLGGLQVWQEESGNLTNFNTTTGFAGTHTNYLVYNLDAGADNAASMNASLSSGSGQSDIRVLIPDTAFINDAAHRFVTVYSLFGSADPADSSGGGFEEWGTATGNGSGVATTSFVINKTATVDGGTANVVGEVISYSVAVDNVGNTNLHNLTVTDPAASGFAAVTSGGYNVGDVNHNNVFDAGESWRYTGNHVVTQADLDGNGGGSGFIQNVAYAGTTETGLTPDKLISDGTAIEVVQNSGLTFLKTPGVASVNAAGQVITYDITAENTGTTSLSSPVVTDPDFVASSTPIVDFDAPILGTIPFLIPVLDPVDPDHNIGDTNHDGVQNGTETFVYVNVGDTNQNGVQDTGETFEFANAGDANGNGAQDAGETFQFYNAGDTDHDNEVDEGETWQFNVSHVVPYASGDGNANGAIDPGETWHWALSYTVTQADIDNGGALNASLSHDNTAFLTTDQRAATDAASVHIVQNPHFTLSKTAAIAGDADGKIDSPADDVTYTVVVHNDGNMTLTGVTVGDSLLTLGAPSGDSVDPGVLNVGETWTYSVVRDTTQADIDNHGNADGTANDNLANTVTADTAQTAAATASANVDIIYDPEVTISKTAALPAGHAQIDSPSDDITYTVTVANTGNVTLTNPVVGDSLLSLGSPSGDGADPGVLNVGETWTYTATHDTTQADIDNRGNVDGTADNKISNTASVDTDQTAATSASADVTIHYNPLLTITKTAALPDGHTAIDSPSDDITYTVTVANAGNVTLTNPVVSDSLSSLGTPTGDTADAGVLNVGETWTYTASHDTLQSDIDDHGNVDGTADDKISNTASAATDQTASQSASADVDINYNPSFTMDVTPLGYVDADASNSVNLGDTIAFAALFTNTGNVTLTNIGVVDEDGIINFNHGVASLAPGDSNGSVTGIHTIIAATDTGIVGDEPLANADQTGNVSDIVDVDYGALSPLGEGGLIDNPDLPPALYGKALAHWDIEHGYF
jgi:uncharacterized repeat protein (TIGR01451 family)